MVHIPSKPSNSDLRSVNDQASHRYVDTYFDQHKSPRFPMGRPFWGWREFSAEKGRADGFVGGDLSCGRCVESDMGEDPAEAWKDSWHAPWIPDFNGGQPSQSFYEFNHLRKRITIRYDKVKAHYGQQRRTFFRAAAILAAQNGWGEVVYGKLPSFAIVSAIGRPPLDAEKLADACLAGDPWILGYTPEVNVELARVLDITPDGLSYIPPAVTPTTTPAAVLQAADENPALQALIAKMVADGIAAADQAKKDAQAARMRAAKKPTRDTASVG